MGRLLLSDFRYRSRLRACRRVSCSSEYISLSGRRGILDCYADLGGPITCQYEGASISLGQIQRQGGPRRAVAIEDFKFHFDLRVRWSECDAQGIAFNGSYLDYLDLSDGASGGRMRDVSGP